MNALDSAAFTGTRTSFNDNDITATSKPFKGMFISEATLNFKFKSEFDSNRAQKLNIPARLTNALLKHERLHLALREYMMKKQLLNLPTLTAQMMGNTAMTAEDAAKGRLFDVADSKRTDLGKVLQAFNILYDLDTQSGGDATAQLDWETNYMKKMDAYLKTELKWAK